MAYSLAPALCASQMKARSASIQDLGRHHHQHQYEAFVQHQQHFLRSNHSNSSAVNVTLHLCELASRDRSSARLADFLRSTQDREFQGSETGDTDTLSYQGGHRRSGHANQWGGYVLSSTKEVTEAAGDITVRDLIFIITNSPFLNAQTRRWIRGKHGFFMMSILLLAN